MRKQPGTSIQEQMETMKQYQEGFEGGQGHGFMDFFTGSFIYAHGATEENMKFLFKKKKSYLIILLAAS